MKKILLLSLVASTFIFSSCNEEEPVPDNTDNNVPSSYNFEDVSFSGQTTRMDMLSEIKAYIKTAHTDTTTTLDETKLSNMFAGTGFSNEDLNNSGKQLANKNASFFDAASYFVDAASASLNGIASEGTSGRIPRGGSYILVDTKGFEYVQVIEKGLMSTVFMDQALNNYLNDIELDNNTEDTYEEGKGTQMAHHWDEAYGYFTDSREFPTAGITRFWGNYSNNENDLIGTNESIGLAFRTGRKAIVDKDTEVVTAQADIIKKEWTKLAAATTIHYFNVVKSDPTNTGEVLHALSEAYGFLLGVKVGGGNVDTILSDLETNGLYSIADSKLTAYINSLASTYGLEAVKGDL